MAKQAKFDAEGFTVVVEDVVTVIDEVEVPPSLLQRIPAKVRGVLYAIGIIAGTIGTLAPVVATLLTGNTQTLAVSIGGLALAVNSLLARANLTD